MSKELDKYFKVYDVLKKRNRWRLIAILLLLTFAVFGFKTTFSNQFTDYVAIIDLTGIIRDDHKLRAVLNKIEHNKMARALILRINSPGGTMVGAEGLYHSIREISDKKPVVAVMGEVATSAGYMVALAADRIVARKTTITGSVGVLMQSADITNLLEKLGIKPQIVKSSELKAQPSPFEPFSSAAREISEIVVGYVHKYFLDLVSERRKLSITDARRLSDGRIFTGGQAIEKGLVDELGGENEARKWLDQKKNISIQLGSRLIEYKKNQGIFSTVLRELFGKTPISNSLRLDGLISLWQPTTR